MLYFRLKRPVQFVLIGAALAAPGCYSSSGDEGDADVGWEVSDPPPPDTWDARDESILYDDPPPPDRWDARDDAGEEAEEEAADWVVDCVPSPNCSDLDTGLLAVLGVEAGADYGVGEVRLDAPDLPPEAYPGCSGGPCLLVVPASGAGTVGDVTAIDRLTYRFRYTNPALAWGDVAQLDLTWRIECVDASGGWLERTVAGTAWACRNDTGLIQITGAVDACPAVVDEVPKPMGPDVAAFNVSGESLQLRAVRGPEGRFRLAARGPEGTRSYRWVASGGTLRMFSPADAEFQPAEGASLFMVQVAAFTPSGVSIQVYRKRRG